MQEGTETRRPPIFVFVADGLHYMIVRGRKEGLLKDLGCRDEANVVINLQYADGIHFYLVKRIFLKP